MAFFSMWINRVCWANSALHALSGVFLCTLRMLLQNSVCRAIQLDLVHIVMYSIGI